MSESTNPHHGWVNLHKLFVQAGLKRVKFSAWAKRILKRANARLGVDYRTDLITLQGHQARRFQVSPSVAWQIAYLVEDEVADFDTFKLWLVSSGHEQVQVPVIAQQPELPLQELPTQQVSASEWNPGGESAAPPCCDAVPCCDIPPPLPVNPPPPPYQWPDEVKYQFQAPEYQWTDDPKTYFGHQLQPPSLQIPPPTTPDPWRVFRHERFGSVRTMRHEGEVWFVAVDVASALGYAKPRDAVWRHCKGVREIQTPSAGGRQRTNIIRLADVVRLVMRSQLADAEAFQDWVCDEMIPQVMHTGTFIDTTRNRPEDAHQSLESMSKGQTWMLLAQQQLALEQAGQQIAETQHQLATTQQHIQHIETQLEDSRQKADLFDQLMDIPAMRECATIGELAAHIPRMPREGRLREAMIEDGYLYRDRGTKRVRVYAEMRMANRMTERIYRVRHNSGWIEETWTPLLIMNRRNLEWFMSRYGHPNGSLRRPDWEVPSR